jgi:hypothetical protein
LIVHFIADNKPWEYLPKRMYKNEYLTYLKMTPWKNFKPKDYNFINVIKKFLFSEKTMNTIRKILGKKVYHWLLNYEIASKQAKTKKNKEDCFKRENSKMETFKITLSKDFSGNGYVYINDLSPMDKMSWHKWFMTNTVSEIIVSEKDYDEKYLDNIKLFLKHNGEFKIEEKTVYKKC